MYMGVHMLTLTQELIVLASFAVVITGIMFVGKEKAADE